MNVVSKLAISKTLLVSLCAASDGGAIDCCLLSADQPMIMSSDIPQLEMQDGVCTVEFDSIDCVVLEKIIVTNDFQSDVVSFSIVLKPATKSISTNRIIALSEFMPSIQDGDDLSISAWPKWGAGRTIVGGAGCRMYKIENLPGNSAVPVADEGEDSIWAVQCTWAIRSASAREFLSSLRAENSPESRFLVFSSRCGNENLGRICTDFSAISSRNALLSVVDAKPR